MRPEPGIVESACGLVICYDRTSVGDRASFPTLFGRNHIYIQIKESSVNNRMDLKRIAMRMKLHKISGSVVHHCAVLKKLLAEKGIKSTVVHGYCISPGEICEHYWVRTDDEGLDLDIGYELACMYNPDLASLKTFLSEEFPPGLKDANGKEPEVLRQEDNTRLFELYETDPVTFWKEAPKDVRTFR